MSDILQELQDLEARSEPMCPALRVASELDEDTKAYVLKLLDNHVVSIRQIHLTLRKAGFSIARDSLTSHRKQECRCYSDE